VIVIADSGAIYALLDRDDSWHDRVRTWWSHSSTRILLPHAVLPEIAFLVGRRLGVDAESAFVDALAAGEFEVAASTDADLPQIATLVHRYRDLPLGFVDASVLAAAARLGAGAILTTDRRHFTIARLPDGTAPVLVP
jgi:predicted nucleic acid-binding protein